MVSNYRSNMDVPVSPVASKLRTVADELQALHECIRETEKVAADIATKVLGPRPESCGSDQGARDASMTGHIEGLRMQLQEVTGDLSRITTALG